MNASSGRRALRAVLVSRVADDKQGLSGRRVRIPRSSNRPEHRRAITLCRGGATFPTGLGGQRTGPGAVPTESAFARGGQTTNRAGEGLKSAASHTRKN